MSGSDMRNLLNIINYNNLDQPIVEEVEQPKIHSVYSILEAMKELREEGALFENNDVEYHTGGSLGTPYPGTYEQEYGMYKTKGPQRITAMTNEALDSSYPYEEYSAGKYTFTTNSGISYKVYLQGKDMVEVAFSAILPGEEENFRPDKTTITGTGDSRKVFGTVVKIVKEYIDTHKPNALYFTAENAEPSRVKLYNRLIAQVDKELPEYKALGNIDLGTGTAYMLKRKESSPSDKPDVAEGTNNRGSIFENTISLADIYDGSYPDSDELIWNFVGDSDFDIPFEVNIMRPMVLDQILCNQYGVDDIEDLFHKMQPEQEAIVLDYQNDPNLSNQIIVLHQDRIIDGNHRALAAVLANKPIKYIDVSEEEV